MFGLPLTIFERERRLRLDPNALEKARAYAPAAPINQIGHLDRLATADDVMPYTPNNDTVYSGAVVELGDGPVILSAPDIVDRYWSVEVADCCLNNLFYVGTRATGGKGGHHAFVAPDWRGTLPPGIVEHRVPSQSVVFALRIEVAQQNDEADRHLVNGLQRQFALTSLANWGDPTKFGEASVPKLAARPHFEGPLAFYRTLAELLKENPPLAGRDDAAAMLLSRGGITVGESFEPAALSDAMRSGLERAEREAPDIMKWKVKFRGTSYPTRWNNLRPGTYGVDYFDRAAGALEGLFVHDREEAVYFSTYEDSDARLLDGSYEYVLRFEPDQIPKTHPLGFWSITMYGSNFQLVKNSIDRFSIGSRSRGLVYGRDGSLEIAVGSSLPSGAPESNWLPSPSSGLFRFNYRIYVPTEAVSNPATMGKFTPRIVRGRRSASKPS